ncbi:MAG: SDR family oxidoreductase [bacterium]
MASYLVTGGAGFIGSSIVERLLQDGEYVKVIDNFSDGKRENIEPFIQNIELVEADIKDISSVRKAVNGVDYVVHVAAQKSVPRSIEDPVGNNNNNINGTLNILLAAKDAGVKRVVFASSSSVYGNQDVFPQGETLPPCPISPYAASKLAGEYYCSVFYEVYELETVSLRYFNVFGPRQDPKSQYANVIPIFINAALRDKAVEVHGDGLQSRDFTYISDTVRATLLAAKAPRAAGHVFNIATGKTYSIIDLVNGIGKIAGSPLKYSHTSPRAGDPRCTLADTSKAKDLLGYTAEVDFKGGLKKTWDWFSSKVVA